MQANIPKAVQFLFSLLWLWGSLASGQSFRTLYDFTTLPAAGTNLDGANPRSYLVQSGGVLYGMTFNGGATGYGSTFKVNTDGTGFTNLHSFTTSGGHPWSGLVLVGDRIYGTSRGSVGPTLGPGIVFALNTDGSGFTNLHVFNASSEGYSPTGGLIASGDTLFGTTSRGATAFKLQTCIETQSGLKLRKPVNNQPT